MDKGTELFDASHELRGTSLICQAASLLAADAPLDEIFERLSGLLATHVDASAVFVASILSGYVIWGNTPEEWAPGGSSPIYRERPEATTRSRPSSCRCVPAAGRSVHFSVQSTHAGA